MFFCYPKWFILRCFLRLQIDSKRNMRHYSIVVMIFQLRNVRILCSTLIHTKNEEYRVGQFIVHKILRLSNFKYNYLDCNFPILSPQWVTLNELLRIAVYKNDQYQNDSDLENVIDSTIIFNHKRLTFTLSLHSTKF